MYIEGCNVYLMRDYSVLGRYTCLYFVVYLLHETTYERIIKNVEQVICL